MFWKRKKKPEPVKARSAGMFSTDMAGLVDDGPMVPTFAQAKATIRLTSDGALGSSIKSNRFHGAHNAQLGFYAAGSYFIGYQACAILSTNWLINKCCVMPARDAIRKGYTLGDEETDLRGTDKKYALTRHLREMVNFGRLYGGRVVLFDVASENPEEWYKNPFNIDGVRPGTYRGLSQIDPNWLVPVLTEANVSDPLSQTYYEPTYWRVGDRVIHRSHLHIFVPDPVPDFLKPTYNYLGMPMPQKIMERVYAAERSANEGPQLLLTKRSIVAKMGDEAFADQARLQENLRTWSQMMNNFGIRAIGLEEEVEHNDTALADVDKTMMTQYQLVASAANIPATKLFGIQPTGFNATGEYEEASYREELEGIQENDLTPLLKRHYELVSRSDDIELPEDLHVHWEPLDSPTAKEQAEIDKSKADRDGLLFDTGAIDAVDIRNRLREDRTGDYHGIEEGAYGEEGSVGQAREVGAEQEGGAVSRLAAFLPAGRDGKV